MRDELGSSGTVVATRRPAALTERQVAERWDFLSRHFVRGDIVVRVRASSVLVVPYATCLRMWTSSSARAQLTRSRIPRLVMIRSSGS